MKLEHLRAWGEPITLLYKTRELYMTRERSCVTMITRRKCWILQSTKQSKIPNKIHYIEDWLLKKMLIFCILLIISVKYNAWNESSFEDFCNITHALLKHEGFSKDMRCTLIFFKLRKNFNFYWQIKDCTFSSIYVVDSTDIFTNLNVAT